MPGRPVLMEKQEHEVDGGHGEDEHMVVDETMADMSIMPRPGAPPPPRTTKSRTRRLKMADNIEEDENEEEEERDERLQRAAETSMTSTVVTSSDTTDLTNQQIQESYAHASEMLQKHKINSKNAFKLKIMDFLPRAVTEDIQKAGKSVETAAGVWGFQVDGLHAMTRKAIAAFGRAPTKNARADGEEGEDKKKARRRRPARDLLETDASKINIVAVHGDDSYEADSLFRKVCSAFDSGKLTGLLMNHARSTGDGRHIQLHSISTPSMCDAHGMPVDFRPTPSLHQEALNKELLGHLRHVIEEGDVNQTSLIPTFARMYPRAAPKEPIPYSILGWSYDREVADEESGGMRADDDEVDDQEMTSRSDVSFRQIDPLTAMPQHDLHVVDPEHEEVEGASQAMGNDDVDDFMEDADVSRRDVSGDQLNIPQKRTRFPALRDVASTVLASKSQTYSFFDKQKVQTLKGPQHWKLKPDKKKAVGKKTRKGRKKIVGPPRVDFEADVERAKFVRHDADGRDPVNNSLTTLKGREESSITLNAIVNYDPANLQRLGLKPDRCVRGRRLDTSDYDNAMDYMNYGAQSDSDDESTEGSPELGSPPPPAGERCVAQQVVLNPDEGDFDVDTGGFGVDEDDEDDLVHSPPPDAQLLEVSETAASTSQQVLVVESAVVTPIANDSLIAEPEQAQVYENYAKKQKKINPHKMKMAMWGILNKAAANATEEPSAAGPSSSSSSLIPMSFSSLVDELPARLSATNRHDLSTPIAFVIFLHLCNDKNLSLKQGDVFTAAGRSNFEIEEAKPDDA